MAKQSAGGTPMRAGDEMLRLLHELQVHQVELEMQNEELREAQGRLEAVLERYTELYDFAPDGYFTVLPDGTIREANLTAAALLGTDRRALLGTRLQGHVVPADGAALRATLTDVLDSGRRRTCEVALGVEPPVPVRLEVALARGGWECCVAMRDITDLRRAEAERRALEVKMWQAQKLESLGVMAGGIAHDFNNLLMAILGHASLAQEKGATPAQTGESLREIECAARRAAELCRQMLAYAGRGQFVEEPVQLSALVAESVRLLRVSIAKNAILHCELAEDLPCIVADPGQLRQVVMNLVINASEALGAGEGSIRVATGTMQCDRDYLSGGIASEPATPGPYVFLEVADSGCGMDAATLGRIFEPFFSTKFTGRGLGLASVLGIVRQHRGVMKVTSAPAQGTVFRVLFPLGLAVAGGASPAPEGSPWRGSGSVLLVDDEEAVRKTGDRMLASWGFRVIQAEDGLQAIDRFRDHADTLRCVLLDLTMPRLGGEATFHELRRLRPDAKVIVMSGYSDAEIVQRLRQSGVAGFLAKPFSAPELNALLKSVLTEGAASRS